MITTLILLGRFLEARARRAGAAIRALLELGAKEARVLRDGDEVSVPDRGAARSATASSSGRARRSPPTASSSEGASAVDQSMLTGEPVPGRGRARAPRSRAATVNELGRLVVRATRVGADTALAQIARLVAEAQAGKAPIQRLVDRVSAVFVPDRDRDLARDARGLARSSRATSADGLHGRRRRADHRLPLRARPRDADRAHGRHGPRRPARHPHQGPGDPRADAPASTTIVLDKTGTVTEGRMRSSTSTR